VFEIDIEHCLTAAPRRNIAAIQEQPVIERILRDSLAKL
jgi:hypothetical protein